MSAFIDAVCVLGFGVGDDQSQAMLYSKPWHYYYLRNLRRVQKPKGSRSNTPVKYVEGSGTATRETLSITAPHGVLSGSLGQFFSPAPAEISLNVIAVLLLEASKSADWVT
jgi:hypothetical protein